MGGPVRRWLLVLAALVLGLALGGLVVASAAPPGGYSPPCTANTDACRQSRIVALENAYRTHDHPSPTPTPTPTPTPSPTPTPTPTPSGSCVMPLLATVGASGTRTASSVTTLNTDGQTLADVDVSSLTINANNVTVRNVRVANGVTVRGDNVMLDRITAQGIGVSSAQGTTIQYSRLTDSAGGDALHVTSDSGRLIHNVTIRNNLIHNPKPPAGSHYDGLQVRGVDGLLVECNRFDHGPYQTTFNAAIYLEDANGNDANVRIVDNWLNGSAWGLMVFNPISATVTGNKFDGLHYWGVCYAAGLTTANFVESGNTKAGAAVDLRAECA